MQGKTAGSTSFVLVPLGDLNKILREDAKVLVSRRFVEMLSLQGEAVESSTKNIKTLVGMALPGAEETEPEQFLTVLSEE